MTVKQYGFIKCLVIIIAQMLFGVYSCILNNNYETSVDFVQLFVNAKNGGFFELENSLFSISLVMNFLNIIVSLILIPLFVCDNNKTKRYYFATRFGSYNKCFIRLFLLIIFYCIISELSFDLGISATILLKYNGVELSNISIVLASVFNSTVVLVFFCVLAVICILLFSDKVGILASQTVFLVSIVLVALLPVELKQYDITSWYYAKDFVLNSTVFTFDRYLYYAMAFAVILVEYFVSQRYLKKDVL